jgi:putative oxidoreductase
MRQDESGTESATRWALRISVALVFAGTGLEKFSSDPTSYWVHVFSDIGLGQWFRYFTGVVEALGGLLFLIPRATPVGAFLLVSSMVGAMAVHIAVFEHPADSLFPGLYLAGVLIAYAKLRGATWRAGSESRRRR